MSPPEDKTIWKELEGLSSLDSGGNFWMSECGDSMTTHWIKPNHYALHPTIHGLIIAVR